MFFLTLKKVATACSTEKPKVLETNPTEEQINILDVWIETNFISRSKKYAVNRYLQYPMTDDRSVEAQSHEIQKIAREIISEGMLFDDQFQVAVIIDKLPPLWKDFKNTLRHKIKEFSLESLITRLRIEEEAKRHDKKEEVDAIPRK
ncbi:hypothetical protein E5676_scaffold313G002960 [Cucumis melo var. makuwa]|uniref:Uncharacterized protein n=1 Tax=Cucumis melo var. makuwa TaxID=1194695 RepID=A0A5D3DSF8_CUCMM|nr:hypothetical protein E5676_scaffold313G002960 [Cucumis melo var. makuwa]